MTKPMSEDAVTLLSMLLYSDYAKSIRVTSQMMVRLIDELPEEKRHELISTAKALLWDRPKGKAA